MQDGQVVDASERHYLNNPTLSDNGAQCGDCEQLRQERLGETPPQRPLYWLRVFDTQMVCCIVVPTLHLGPLSSVAFLRFSVGLLIYNLFEVACRPSHP